MWYVYKKTDPDLLYEVRYVGYTENPRKRFIQHLSDINEDSLKGEWLRSLSVCGKVPCMFIIEEVRTLEEAREREMYWINFYLELHMPLVNADLPRSGMKLPNGYMHGARNYIKKLPPKDENIQAQIKLLYAQGLPMREISKAVGLYGSNYKKFQVVCRELGISTLGK